MSDEGVPKTPPPPRVAPVRPPSRVFTPEQRMARATFGFRTASCSYLDGLNAVKTKPAKKALQAASEATGKFGGVLVDEIVTAWLVENGYLTKPRTTRQPRQNPTE